MQFTRDPSGTIEVEGETYAWEIRRQPRPVGGAVWEGMAVSLRHVDFKREAIIQFPPPSRRAGIRPRAARPWSSTWTPTAAEAVQGRWVKTRNPGDWAMASISASPEVSP